MRVTRARTQQSAFFTYSLHTRASSNYRISSAYARLRPRESGNYSSAWALPRAASGASPSLSASSAASVMARLRLCACCCGPRAGPLLRRPSRPARLGRAGEEGGERLVALAVALRLRPLRLRRWHASFRGRLLYTCVCTAGGSSSHKVTDYIICYRLMT